MRPGRLLRPAVQATIAVVSLDRVIGDDLTKVGATGAGLRRLGYEVTPGYWNEDGASPAAVVARYEQTLDIVRSLSGRRYLSIKAPAFDCDAGLYGRLLDAAGERGVALHLDALGPEVADQTLSLATGSAPPHALPTGLTLPGRWRRSPDDAGRLADLDLPIRVVKGEWADPDALDLDLRTGYLDVIARLAGRAAGVRVATHDWELAEAAVRILRDAGTPCDLELLYGFPVRHLLPRLAALDVPIRLYVPFGHGWLPYCLDHVRARPALLWWLVRDSLAGRYQRGFPRLHPPASE